jgi:polyisoprenoid-binding protein YceI
MKKLLIAALVLAGTLRTTAQTVWNIDNGHSKIGFTVTHLLISEVEGNFKEFTATLTASKEDFNDSKVEFTAKTASVNTEDEKRDAHLKGDDFFNAEKFPEITFVSTSFKKVADKKFKMNGKLTMKGVTKDVVLDVIHSGTVNDPWGNTKAGFKITGKINRKDYGISWGAVLDNGGAVVSDEVQLKISVELTKAK